MISLVTGASGFIGRRLVKRLVESGHSVIAYNHRQKPELAGVVQIIGDISVGTGFDQIPWADIDQIYHLAASGVKASSRSWSQALQVNVSGTQNLIEAVQQRATKCPVFLTTSTFYERALGERSALDENPYIATKAVATRLVRSWAANYLGRVVIDALFQVYGPGDDDGNILSYAAGKLKNDSIAKFSSRSLTRDWIYVDDAADGILSSTKDAESKIASYDIGSGFLTSLGEVLSTLSKVAEIRDPKYEFDESLARGDMGLVQKAEKMPPGWQPSYSLTEGLTQLYMGIG
ncbi:GDP-6-deoxy-D-mannose reductase [mine drainage metagenome]|uniref:GDP-6-deoxy-D-mannose reductase n=1 Tax=mine drainage metagenome TaxID=410659 RepID=A0A1J5R369_9ZZZZ